MSFKNIFLFLLGVLLAFMMYMVLVPPSATQKSVSPTPKPIVVVEEPEEMAPMSIPVEVSTTGNEKITKVSVGDKEEHKKINVHSHVYTVIDKAEDLYKLEHTLSYVILPRNLSGYSDKVSDLYKRYVQVLDQIQELRKISKSNIMVSKASRFPRTDNHFVLFKKGEEQSRVTIDNYNYALSYKVIDFFKEKYPEISFDKEGPYIITTARNVMNGAEDFSFIYMNLSTFNNSAVREAIESYKSRLVNKGNSDIERLEGWRYLLLAVLTNFNADIHIVRSAVAGDL